VDGDASDVWEVWWDLLEDLQSGPTEPDHERSRHEPNQWAEDPTARLADMPPTSGPRQEARCADDGCQGDSRPSDEITTCEHPNASLW
jgi:hypothetical protein